MNAQLKPIETRAVVRPEYDNTHVKHVCIWARDNDKALREYYATLGRSMPKNEEDGLTAFAKAQAFCAWVQCQHDYASGRFI